jgi:hypothetical protein
MSHQPAVRDPFYSTLAVAAAAVLCLAAFTPAGPQAPRQTAPAPQAMVVAMPVAAAETEAPRAAQEATIADLELVGMSIANYDR